MILAFKSSIKMTVYTFSNALVSRNVFWLALDQQRKVIGNLNSFFARKEEGKEIALSAFCVCMCMHTCVHFHGCVQLTGGKYAVYA